MDPKEAVDIAINVLEFIIAVLKVIGPSTEVWKAIKAFVQKAIETFL